MPCSCVPLVASRTHEPATPSSEPRYSSSDEFRGLLSMRRLLVASEISKRRPNASKLNCWSAPLVLLLALLFDEGRGRRDSKYAMRAACSLSLAAAIDG